MDLGLKGRKALVTGATRGIGRAIAETLAAEGCAVAFCARDKAAVADMTAHLARYDVPVEGRAFDVADHNLQSGFISAMGALWNGLDIFVPNVSARAGQGVAQWRKNFEVDVLSTVTGCEAAMPWLKRSDAGSLVIIGSIAAVETFWSASSYNAMKASLITYGKQLSQEVAADGVRVNIVSPGPIYFSDGVWGEAERDNPAAYQAMLAKMPMGRMGTPDEVARAVAFLASPAASLITGTNLIADGGFTKRVQF